MAHRWIKGLNISFASEKRQRALTSDFIGDNITAEKGAFSFSGHKDEEIREDPSFTAPAGLHLVDCPPPWDVGNHCQELSLSHSACTKNYK